jgi:hypothetical protein
MSNPDKSVDAGTLRKRMSELGKKGGPARAKSLTARERLAIACKASKAAAKAWKSLTPEQRTAFARRAGQARWAKERKAQNG